MKLLEFYLTEFRKKPIAKVVNFEQNQQAISAALSQDNSAPLRLILSFFPNTQLGLVKKKDESYVLLLIFEALEKTASQAGEKNDMITISQEVLAQLCPFFGLPKSSPLDTLKTSIRKKYPNYASKLQMETKIQEN